MYKYVQICTNMYKDREYHRLHVIHNLTTWNYSCMRNFWSDRRNKHFRSCRWGSLLTGLHTEDPPLSPPSA